MKIIDFRKKYPEYDDIDDNTVMEFIRTQYYDDMPKEEFDALVMDSTVAGALNEVNKAFSSFSKLMIQKDKAPRDKTNEMTRLLSQIRDNVNQTDNAGICNAIMQLTSIIENDESQKCMIDILDQIKSQLSLVENAIKAIDKKPVVNVPAPVVNVPAPIVNVPQQSQQIEIPPVVIPEPAKEWKFEIKRDRNGYISEIVARA